MDRLLSRTSKLDSVLLIFVSVLLLSFHFFFIYFITSTYVAAFVGEKFVSLIYAIGAILNICVFLFAPRILRRFGIIKMTLGLAAIEAISLIFLAFPFHPSIAIGAFFLHMSVSSALIYCMDMLLEQFSKSEKMGSMRGMFLTMWNIPPLITPFIAGLILGNNVPIFDNVQGSVISILHNAGFWKIYIIAAVFLIPFAIILKANFNNLKDPEYPRMHLKDTIQAFYRNHNLFDVFADRLLLNLYFAWNVVFLPIYLHEYIGFTWNQIGILFSTMLLPAVLFQRMIGKLQDKNHQEKSILIAGFLIMSVATIIQPFLTEPSMFAWMLILFVANIGAAFVEVSSESYFFRHVSTTNSGFISLFRMTRTLPYIIIPPITALCLFFLPFGHMFIILGLIMFIGVRYAFLIRDEKRAPLV